MSKRALVCVVLSLAACSDDDSGSARKACDDACAQLATCDDQSDGDACPDVCAATGPALDESNCAELATSAYRCIADGKLCELDDANTCTTRFEELSACISALCASDTSNPVCFDQSYAECVNDCSNAATCDGGSADACDDRCSRDNLTAAAADCRAEVDALYACRASAPDRCDTASRCENAEAALDACMATYCADHGNDQSTLCDG